MPSVPLADRSQDTVFIAVGVNGIGRAGEEVYPLREIPEAPGVAVITREVDATLGGGVKTFSVAGNLVGIVFDEFPIGVYMRRHEGEE